MSSSNNINGSIVLVGLPDTLCYQTIEELVNDLPNILQVSIDPPLITNVIVSATQPLSGQAGSVWFRVSNGGTFIGIYMFSGGTWTQVFPAPGEIRWVVGDSANPPAGFILTDNAAYLSSAIKAHLHTFWYPNGGSGPWQYFSVVPAVN